MKRSHLLALLEFTHDMAENYLVWSPERILCLENAHQAFMQWRKRKKGRPNKEDGVDSDIRALMYMGEQRRKTGETSNRKLARMAIEAGLVKKKGSMDSRIERLARKYGNRRRESARQPRLTDEENKRWLYLYNALARDDLNSAERERLDAEMDALMRKMLGEKSYKAYQREQDDIIFASKLRIMSKEEYADMTARYNRLFGTHMGKNKSRRP